MYSQLNHTDVVDVYYHRQDVNQTSVTIFTNKCFSNKYRWRSRNVLHLALYSSSTLRLNRSKFRSNNDAKTNSFEAFEEINTSAAIGFQYFENRVGRNEFSSN